MVYVRRFCRCIASAVPMPTVLQSAVCTALVLISIFLEKRFRLPYYHKERMAGVGRTRILNALEHRTFGVSLGLFTRLAHDFGGYISDSPATAGKPGNT